jgi:hypothetical protein
MARRKYLTQKRSRKKKQTGGNCRNCLMITLMVFIALIYISGIFDYGKTIDDYITINEGGIELAEQLGVGLIEYDHRVNRILDGMLENIDDRSINSGISYNLRLDGDLQIDDIDPYLTDMQKTITDRDRFRLFGDYDLKTRDLTGYYDSRQFAKEYNRDWRIKQHRDQSYIEEQDINTMLETFMPKILSMSNSGIPDNIQFSALSLSVSRSPFGPQNFHQDIDQITLTSSATADHEYRIMLFDRDERYDTSWTQIATEIDDRRAEKYVKTSFARYDFAKLIDFDINKSKYIALIFDNTKVFHRTPPTAFFDWLTNNIPDKRRVTQFRIAWDDYDQVNYEGEGRFQEIMNGGGYKIV